MTKKLFLFMFVCFLAVALVCGNNVSAFANNVEVDIMKDFTAKSLLLIDGESGEFLFEKNSQEKLPIASIVKLMTIYLTCENIENGDLKLTDTIVASNSASSMGGSQVFIEEGGEYTVGDLLKSTIVSSANDASVLLAETIAGTESNFVNMMNKKASDLGLKNTNYVNCTGLPACNQYSCAQDVATLLKEVVKFDEYHLYSGIWIDTLSHPKGRTTELVNTNKMIRNYKGCDGGKTGSTGEAGYCLACTAKRDNMRLISVVLGAENGKKRFSESTKLLNYGFSNFEKKLIVSKDFLQGQTVCVKSGKVDFVSVAPKEEISLIMNKYSSEEIQTRIEISDCLEAPIKNGQAIGVINVIKNGEVIKTVDIITTNSVEKENYVDEIKSLIENWQINA